MAHASIPKHLSNHYQVLRLIFSEICTKSDARWLSNPQRYCFMPDTRFQIKRVKVSTNIQVHEILYTYFQHMCTLSSTVALRYYNWCIDGKMKRKKKHPIFKTQANYTDRVVATCRRS
jgi:hypothetical protein